MIGSNLHRFKTNAKYCGFDFEAENLNLRVARPFQVAYCTANNKEIHSIKSDYIYWDDINVSKRAAEITHFKLDQYKQQARPAKKVLDEFESIIFDKSFEIIWQNGLGYDIYIHQNWRRGVGKSEDFSYILRSIDLTALTKAFKKQWKPDISCPEAFLAWQYKCHKFIEKSLRSQLEYCGKEEKIEHDYSKLHDAVSDIELMMKIFEKRLYQVEF